MMPRAKRLGPSRFHRPCRSSCRAMDRDMAPSRYSTCTDRETRSRQSQGGGRGREGGRGGGRRGGWKQAFTAESVTAPAVSPPGLGTGTELVESCSEEEHEQKGGGGKGRWVLVWVEVCGVEWAEGWDPGGPVS